MAPGREMALSKKAFHAAKLHFGRFLEALLGRVL
jgi:hypothetical protein